MHKLNFCKDLCLPIEGFEGSRGLKVLKEFPEGVIIPMAGIATPEHALYVSKPILHSPRFRRERILGINELDQESKVRTLLELTNDSMVSPDSSLDPSPLADASFRERDGTSLNFVIDALFRRGREKVVVWSNNGIGFDTREESGPDGVIRNIGGIAYATKSKGEVKPSYQKGLDGSYQNSAHQHIHIAPTTHTRGFDEAMISILDSLHEGVSVETLETQRAKIREDPRYLPCISVAVADRSTPLGSPLVFRHYSSRPEGRSSLNFAGLARTIVQNHSRLVRGLDFDNKETKKQEIAKTVTLYSSL